MLTEIAPSSFKYSDNNICTDRYSFGSKYTNDFSLPTCNRGNFLIIVDDAYVTYVWTHSPFGDVYSGKLLWHCIHTQTLRTSVSSVPFRPSKSTFCCSFVRLFNRHSFVLVEHTFSIVCLTTPNLGLPSLAHCNSSESTES